MTDISKIVIVEDEPLIAEHLCAILETINIQSAIYEVDDDIVDRILYNQPDLVFLDINLNTEEDGISIAKKLKTLSIPFMFITSYYDESTLQRARATEPLAYILKPFSKETIYANIEIARAKIRRRSQEKDIDTGKPIFIRIDNELKSIAPEEILFLEAYDNYCFIHTTEGRLLASKSLKVLEKSFHSAGIIRVHRSFAINLLHISAIREDCVHINDKVIRVGKQYKQNLLRNIQIL